MQEVARVDRLLAAAHTSRGLKRHMGVGRYMSLRLLNAWHLERLGLLDHACVEAELAVELMQMHDKCHLTTAQLQLSAATAASGAAGAATGSHLMSAAAPNTPAGHAHPLLTTITLPTGDAVDVAKLLVVTAEEIRAVPAKYDVARSALDLGTSW